VSLGGSPKLLSLVSTRLSRPFETLAEMWVEEGAQRPSRNLAPRASPRNIAGLLTCLGRATHSFVMRG
jgi:hypothetical protein